MRRPVPGVILVVLAIVLAGPAAASALGLKRVASGFGPLTQVTAPRSGDPVGTLYIVTQEGRVVRRAPAGGGRNEVLDIRGSVLAGGERGLFSIAFDPSFASNRFVYVSYTNNSGDSRVVRYRLTPSHKGIVRGSRKRLIRVHQPDSNHNGGQLAFSTSGRLYFGLGDGGGSCDPRGRAQRLTSRLGKLLSIDPRNLRAGWRKDAYGLRNPWRFSFDRAGGRLWLGDVGQNRWEEVDTLAQSRLGGTPENFGWDVFEGRRRSGCDNTGLHGNGRLVRPVNVYGHGTSRCSITGGFVYRGQNLPARFRGWYFFADWCSGQIWRYKRGSGRQLVRNTPHNITSFGEGSNGTLFVATGGGQVFRIVG
ncbi:MAG TPA: PQQ-dependent sugar dehydrogenase [Gaiellaceae bacterium]|jgi:glucose/arabinose dehydrogenase|nr:PQQ-dependent sugar dehydrogenase [Gaiellaceae bacterium]